MSLEEAKNFGIDPEERLSYLRHDSAKVNIAPPSRNAKWFKLVGVPLGNGTEKYPEGDFVQAMEVWTPPETWQGMEADIVEAILLDIERGMANGQRYANHHNAGEARQAWRLVQEHCPDKDESACREIVKEWVKKGTIYTDKYDDPVERKERQGLFRKKAAS